MSTIYLKSAFGKPSPGIVEAAARGEAVIIEQSDFTAEMLGAHRGLISGQQLDQDAMLTFKPALEAFLDRGGRWFFNGHMVRPLVDGMAQYRPIAEPKRADFDLAAINPHPIYDGVELTTAMSQLLRDVAIREAMAAETLKIIEENRGAAAKSVEHLKMLL